MKLEHQVTSLELSKRLRELGVKQESLFYWVNGILDRKNSKLEISQLNWDNKHKGNSHAIYSAFTVAELGEMLPTYNPSYRLIRNNTKENVFICENNSNADIAFTAETEADARAKMLIYLIENNLKTTLSQKEG